MPSSLFLQGVTDQLGDLPAVLVTWLAGAGLPSSAGAAPCSTMILSRCLGEHIAAATVEPHRMNVVAEQRQRLLSGELMRNHPVLQRSRDADRGLHDRTQLVDPVVEHPPLHQRCRCTDRDNDGKRRKAEQEGQLGAEFEVAEDAHWLFMLSNG